MIERLLHALTRLWSALLLLGVVCAAVAIAARLLLPLGDAPPRLLATVPPEAAASLTPFTRARLTFATPMNPPSVAAALTLDPPTPFALSWDAARTTFVVSPTAPLQPDTSYRLTVGTAALSQRYRPLAAPATLTFHIAPAPAVSSVLPPDGAAAVAPDTPVSIRFSRPIVAADQVGRQMAVPALSFTPPLAGAATWLDRTTLLFVPDAPLAPGVSYTASLSDTLTDTAGSPLDRTYRWSFSARPPPPPPAAPLPGVIGSNPGDGQRHPLDRAIRLVFRTPVDAEVLATAVAIDPPAPIRAIDGAGSEIRIDAALRASTSYTLTLPATLTDRAGSQLGHRYTLRFTTAAAPPLLALPEAADHLLRTAPDAPAQLLVRRTNLAAIAIDIYPVDVETLARAATFDDAEWASFQPERYGLRPARSWSVGLSDLRDAVAEDRVPIALDDGALPVGGYYLRLRSAEGQRADLLLLASARALVIQTGADALLWLTDAAGLPVATAPITLYQGGAPVRSGQTDAAGLWVAGQTAGLAPGPIVASDGGAALAVGQIAPPPLAAPTIAAIADAAVYAPGEELRIAGFVNGAPGISAVDIRLLPRGIIAAAPAIQSQTPLQSGAFRFAARLPLQIAPGSYDLTLAAGGGARAIPIQIVGDDQPLLIVASPAGDGQATLRIVSADGRPIPGARIAWSLRAAQASPAREGFRFPATSPVETVSAGGGTTDAAGRLTIPLSPTAALDAPPLRYAATVQVDEPGGASASAALSIDPPGAAAIPGIRLPSAVLAPGETTSVQLRVLTASGAVPPPTRLQLTAERQLPDGRTQRVANRTITTGTDGAAAVPLSFTAPGRYTIAVATAARPAAAASAELWVASADRPALDLAPQPQLVADRAAYRVGDTAQLLPLLPQPSALAVVSLERADGISATVRLVRSGVPLTVTVRQQDAAGLRVAMLPLGSPAPIVASLAVQPPQLRIAAITDSPRYLPGQTATITIAVSDERGDPVRARLLIADAPLQIGQSGERGLGGEPAPARCPPVLAWSCAAGSSHWIDGLSTGDDGVATIALPLDAESPGTLRILADDGTAGGQVDLALAVLPTLDATLRLPPAARADDQLAATLAIVNRLDRPQTITATLTISGALQPATPTQRVTIGPGVGTVLRWPLTAAGQGAIVASVQLASDAAPPRSVRASAQLLQRSADQTAPLGVLRQLRDPSSGAILDPAALRVGQLIAIETTLTLHQPLLAGQIILPLPGGTALVANDTPAARRSDALTLQIDRATLPPGVYRYRAVVRATGGGRFALPPVVVQDTAVIAASQPLTLQIQE